MAYSAIPFDRTKSWVGEYENGDSTPVIAARAGVHPWTVTKYLKLHGCTLRDPKKHRRKYRLNEAAFDDLTPDTCYWLGFLLADGCVHRRRNGQTVVCLGLSDADRHHVEAFGKFLGTDKPVRTAPVRTGFKTARSASSLHVTSARLAEVLAGYGIVPRKSKIAVPDPRLVHSRDFWRGMVDGDGFISWGRSSCPTGRSPIVGLVGTKPCVEEFSRFVETVAGRPTTAVRPVHSIWGTRTTGHNAIRLLRHLYYDGCVSLPRKQQFAKDALAEYQPTYKSPKVTPEFLLIPTNN